MEKSTISQWYGPAGLSAVVTALGFLLTFFLVIYPQQQRSESEIQRLSSAISVLDEVIVEKSAKISDQSEKLLKIEERFEQQSLEVGKLEARIDANVALLNNFVDFSTEESFREHFDGSPGEIFFINFNGGEPNWFSFGVSRHQNGSFYAYCAGGLDSITNGAFYGAWIEIEVAAQLSFARIREDEFKRTFGEKRFQSYAEANDQHWKILDEWGFEGFCA